jgi:hypothetical protein
MLPGQCAFEPIVRYANGRNLFGAARQELPAKRSPPPVNALERPAPQMTEED